MYSSRSFGTFLTKQLDQLAQQPQVVIQEAHPLLKYIGVAINVGSVMFSGKNIIRLANATPNENINTDHKITDTTEYFSLMN